jgi:hypothetical protein
VSEKRKMEFAGTRFECSVAGYIPLDKKRSTDVHFDL